MKRPLALVLMLVTWGTMSAAADWSAGFGHASFDSAPACVVPSVMAGGIAYERWLAQEDGYLELALADPYCPQVYLEETLVFHGWLEETGSCFSGSFPWGGSLCLSDPVVVDAVTHRFTAVLCVDAAAEPWCTRGEVGLTLV